MTKLLFKVLMVSATLCSPLFVGAQGMSINTTGSTADHSAMLDVSSTTQGMLVPRMTAAQLAAIATPATGLLVYQTDGTAGFYYNSGTPASPNWISLNAAVDASALTGTTLASNVVNSSLTSAAGGTFGTAAYTDATNYLTPSSTLSSANLSGALPALDGSALTNLPAGAAGSLTGTTLASNVVNSSLTGAAGGTFGTAAYTNASSYLTSSSTLNSANLSGALPALDGSALTNLPAEDAGSLTGTTLASNVVNSSLTSAAGGTFGTAAYTDASSYLTSSSTLNSSNLSGALPALDGSALTGIIPTQTGNSGKFLTTNGSSTSWASNAGLSNGSSAGQIYLTGGSPFAPQAAQTVTGDVTINSSAVTSYNNVVPTSKGGAGAVNGLLSANGAGTVSAASTTGSGNVVLSTSPTLVTPNLGTITSGNGAALTGLQNIANNSTAGTSIATALNSASAGSTAGTVTGSGAVVLSSSPTLVSPSLGTPTALVGTNISGTASFLTAGNVTTNANSTGDVTSTGNATTISNSGLAGVTAGNHIASALQVATSGITGSGSVVLATSPTLASPNLGTIQSGDGNALTNLNGSNIGTGTVPAARGGAGTVNGILKANGSGSVSAAVAGTDYLTPTGDGSGLTGVVAAANNNSFNTTMSFINPGTETINTNYFFSPASAYTGNTGGWVAGDHTSATSNGTPNFIIVPSACKIIALGLAVNNFATSTNTTTTATVYVNGSATTMTVNVTTNGTTAVATDKTHTQTLSAGAQVSIVWEETANAGLNGNTIQLIFQ